MQNPVKTRVDLVTPSLRVTPQHLQTNKMHLLILPFLECNLACKYCYEKEPRRKNLVPRSSYNLLAVLHRMDTLKETGFGKIDLMGGELLALPKKDLETLFMKINELKEGGYVGQYKEDTPFLQTNATLINDGHIALFKKYNVLVGVSWDGPGELSAYRPGTANVGKTIKRLVGEGVRVNVITVVSRANAGTPERIKKLKNYLLYLNNLNIQGRLAPCFGISPYELSLNQLKKVYLDLADFCLKNGLRWSPFTDIVHGFRGEGTLCYFSGCDHFAADVAVVLGDGSLTNCPHTFGSELILRDPAAHKTRDEILQKTPQKYGGCQGCRFWAVCHGGCPVGCSVGGPHIDWRNRTYLCPLYKALFTYFEKRLTYCDLVPLSPQENLPEEPDLLSPEKAHGDSHGDSPHGDHTNVI